MFGTGRVPGSRQTLHITRSNPFWFIPHHRSDYPLPSTTTWCTTIQIASFSCVLEAKLPMIMHDVTLFKSQTIWALPTGDKVLTGIMVEKLVRWESAKKVSSPTDVDDWMGKSNSTPPISQSNNRERTQSEMKMNKENIIFSFVRTYTDIFLLPIVVVVH